MNSRRHFLSKLIVSTAAPAILCRSAFGQTPPPVKLEESDPMAAALGYKNDTTQVDAQKYPQHKTEQKCSNCALFQGKAGDASGPCGAVGGKVVASNGWCMVYAKKPEVAK